MVTPFLHKNEIDTPQKKDPAADLVEQLSPTLQMLVAAPAPQKNQENKKENNGVSVALTIQNLILCYFSTASVAVGFLFS